MPFVNTTTTTTGSKNERCYQCTAITIGAAAWVLWMCVFLMNDTVIEHRMVSSNLFHSAWYMWSMTFLVGMQQIISALFVSRFRKVALFQTICCAIGIFIACLGWGMVIGFNPDTQSTAHVAGSGLFALGTFLYNLCILHLAFRFDARSAKATLLHYDMAITFTFILAVLSTVLYIALFFSPRKEDAWLFQNGALLFAFGYFIVFFWFHPFDPAELVIIYATVPPSDHV